MRSAFPPYVGLLRGAELLRSHVERGNERNQYWRDEETIIIEYENLL